MDLEQRAKLYEELVNFRLSLPRPGRTCVGSTSLSTGISIELIMMLLRMPLRLPQLRRLKVGFQFLAIKLQSIFDIVKNFIGNVNVM